MPRNYQVERDAIFRRWYGNNPQPLNPRPNRSPGASVIGPEDCLGIPIPVNLPFMPWGHCMVWKYTLNQGGYGVQRAAGSNSRHTGWPTSRQEGRYLKGNRSTTFATGPTVCSRPTSTQEPIRTTVTTREYSATLNGCTTRGCSTCRQVISRTNCGSA